jgi:hypothetical protein
MFVGDLIRFDEDWWINALNAEEIVRGRKQATFDLVPSDHDPGCNFHQSIDYHVTCLDVTRRVSTATRSRRYDPHDVWYTDVTFPSLDL